MCAECHSTGVRKNYDAAKDRFATTFCRDQRRLRGLPRPRLAARRLGAGPQRSWWPFGKTDDPDKGAASFASTSGATSPGRSIPRPAMPCAASRRATLAQGGRDLRPLPRAPRPVLRSIGSRADGCPTRTWSRRSARVSIMPTGRCSTRSTTTAHSSRARCSRPASPAAIATSRTAPSFARRAMASACNAMPPTSMRRQRHRPPRGGEPAARPAPRATCRRAPTWWSTGGTTTASAFRGLICRQSSARPTPAMTATPTRSPEWAAAAIERWHGPNRKGFQNYAEAFHAAWTGRGRRGRPACRKIAADRAGAGVRARQRADRARPYALAVERRCIGARRHCPIPTPWCGSARSTCLKVCPLDQLWPLVSPLLVRSRSRRAHQGGVAARGCPERAASRQPTASASSARRPNSSPHSSSMPTGRKRARRWDLLTRGAALAAEAEAEYKAALRLSPQYAPAAINLADLYRQLGRDADGENVLRTRSPPRRGTPGCIMRSA